MGGAAARSPDASRSYLAGARFEPAMGPATLCGLAVETDDATGLARRVAAVRLGGRLEEAQPTFWE